MATATAGHDRGSFGLSAFTLVVIGALIGLGVWQLQRRAEKHALIAALTDRLGAAPAALPPPDQWQVLTAEHDEFRRVAITATFRDAPDAKVYASGSALRTDVTTLGTFVFAPITLADGTTLVVDRGFVPDGAKEAAPLREPMTMTGYIRFPEKPGWITPAPDVGKRLWFARDHIGMAKTLSWGSVAPFYLDLESPAPPSGLPRPGPLDVHLKDDHLQYAITWFGLAAAVAVTFAIWLRGRKRSQAAT
jgi:cytochrome oxidase assembly protein ShyY1